MSYPELNNDSSDDELNQVHGDDAEETIDSMMDTEESTTEPSRPPARDLATADDLTRFQIDILAVIAGHETGSYTNSTYPNSNQPHGLSIKEILSSRYKEEVNHGRLYPNLQTLENKGLIEKSEKDKRTNEYQLTRRGIDTITSRASWLQDVVDPDWEAMQDA